MGTKTEFSCKLEGARELDEALKTLPKATGKNALKRALVRAAEPIAAAAAAMAPRLTGELKASIKVGTVLSSNQRRQHEKQGDVEVFAGAGPLPQAHLVEFGTAHSAPEPFMRPAWDGGKMRALQSIKSDLAEEIEKARQRLARKAARLSAKT